MEHVQSRTPLPLEPVAACPVCGESGRTVLYCHAPVDLRFLTGLPKSFQQQQFTFVRCTRCDLIYLAERPAKEDLEVYYGDTYALGYKQTRLFTLAHKIYDYITYTRLKRYAQTLSGILPRDISILDYGCGNAMRIRHFHAFNAHWKCQACDRFINRISSNVPDAIHTFQSDYTRISEHVAPESLDIITAFHVIEHVDDPLAMLQAMHPLLKNNGLLHLEFPAGDSWESSVFESVYLSFHVPCHFIMPTRKSIACMAEKAGFTVVRHGNELRSAADLWIEIESKIRERIKIPKTLFDLLRLPLAAALLPLELIQSARGKKLSTQYAVLQKR